MTEIDINTTSGELIIASKISECAIIITGDAIRSYLKILERPDHLFAYKDARFDPCTFSLGAGRYNCENQGCAYTAESIRLAQAEVESHGTRQLYRVNTDLVYYLDAVCLAEDYGFTDTLVAHVSAGGWIPTQRLASLFTHHYGLTALRVPSAKGSGACVDFYADSCLPKDFFVPVH